MSHLHPGTADADSHGMPLHHSTFYKYGEMSYSPNASDMVAPAKIQEPWTIDQRAAACDNRTLKTQALNTQWGSPFWDDAILWRAQSYSSSASDALEASQRNRLCCLGI